MTGRQAVSAVVAAAGIMIAGAACGSQAAPVVKVKQHVVVPAEPGWCPVASLNLVSTSDPFGAQVSGDMPLGIITDSVRAADAAGTSQAAEADAVLATAMRRYGCRM